MSLIRMNHFSKALESSVEIVICFPSSSNIKALNQTYEETYVVDKKLKVLYLLHGALDDGLAWITNTNIEELADKYQVAVVMPSCQNSFYVNTKHGLNYHDFITIELPLLMESVYNVSSNPEERFIAGLSMGGYGSLYSALTKPESYRAVGSFSGVVDIVKNVEDSKNNTIFTTVKPEYIFNYKDELKNSPYDLFHLIDEFSVNKDQQLGIYIECGDEDFLIDMHRKIKNKFVETNTKATVGTFEGKHNWKYWNGSLSRFFNWLAANQFI